MQPGGLEPGLRDVNLSVFNRWFGFSSMAASTGARQLPLICMVSSQDSTMLVAYSMPAPCALAVPAGLDADSLTKQPAHQVGDVRAPLSPAICDPRRRWELPSATTSMAVSPCGSLFAAGGAGGSLALVDTGGGLSLRAMLPGHYAAVTAVSFHRAAVLVTVGQDAFIHHYRLEDNSLMGRYLCAPPPQPPPLRGIAVAQVLPVALSLDTTGGLRLLDIMRARKLAYVSCEVYDVAPVVPNEDKPNHGVKAGDIPQQILAGSSAFCVFCETRSDDSQATVADVSSVTIFDYTAVVKHLCPSSLSRSTRGGQCVTEAFGKFLPKEQGKVQQPPDLSGSLVKLTAENLRRMGKPGGGTCQFAGSGLTTAGGQVALRAEEDRHPRRVRDFTENWQVSVRHLLRMSVNEKESRRRRIGARMDMLRKELGDVALDT